MDPVNPPVYRPPRRSWAKKFASAARGCREGMRGQSSFVVHLVMAVAVVMAALLLGLSVTEWGLVVLCIDAGDHGRAVQQQPGDTGAGDRSSREFAAGQRAGYCQRRRVGGGGWSCRGRTARVRPACTTAGYGRWLIWRRGGTPAPSASQGETKSGRADWRARPQSSLDGPRRRYLLLAVRVLPAVGVGPFPAPSMLSSGIASPVTRGITPSHLSTVRRWITSRLTTLASSS